MSTPLDRAQKLVNRLSTEFKTIILGTASPDGEPDASPVAAVLGADGTFYIYVSGLAVHTRHLVANRRASVLLLEEEIAVAQPFARHRLTFFCAASIVPSDGAPYVAIVAALRGKFGAPVDLLTSLPDFQLIGLAPQRGRLVVGFGEAYEVDPHDWSKLTPVGRARGASAAR